MRTAFACVTLAACLAGPAAAQSIVRPRSRAHAPARFHGPAAAISALAVSKITHTGFTVSWTTNQPLNSQLLYGAGSLSQSLHDATLTTQHSLTVTGLTPGTPYSFVAESSYYTYVDVKSAEQTATTAGAAPAPAPPPAPPRLFPSPAADWLYSAPTGTGLNISHIVAGFGFGLDTHDGGFDYPVVYTDGTHGCTNFTDTLQYNFGDHYCVPNPPNGYWPSVGGWGANDGHLVVVDTSTRTYYDFWKLYVNSQGQPVSTNVGGIRSGSLDGNGTPGDTATDITGLAGDILPGELDCATCLNHALLAIVPGTMNSPQLGTQAPANNTDGSVPGAIFREGAKLRLGPSLDLSTLHASTAALAIMRALQLYGAVICDQSGATGIAFYTALPSQPDLSGLNQIGQYMLIYY